MARSEAPNEPPCRRQAGIEKDTRFVAARSVLVHLVPGNRCAAALGAMIGQSVRMGTPIPCRVRLRLLRDSNCRREKPKIFAGIRAEAGLVGRWTKRNKWTFEVSAALIVLTAASAQASRLSRVLARTSRTLPALNRNSGSVPLQKNITMILGSSRDLTVIKLVRRPSRNSARGRRLARAESLRSLNRIQSGLEQSWHRKFGIERPSKMRLA